MCPSRSFGQPSRSGSPYADPLAQTGHCTRIRNSPPLESCHQRDATRSLRIDTVGRESSTSVSARVSRSGSTPSSDTTRPRVNRSTPAERPAGPARAFGAASLSLARQLLLPLFVIGDIAVLTASAAPARHTAPTRKMIEAPNVECMGESVTMVSAANRARPPASAPLTSRPVQTPEARTSAGNWQARNDPEAASRVGKTMPTDRISASQMMTG